MLVSTFTITTSVVTSVVSSVTFCQYFSWMKEVDILCFLRLRVIFGHIFTASMWSNSLPTDCQTPNIRSSVAIEFCSPDSYETDWASTIFLHFWRLIIPLDVWKVSMTL